MAALLRLAVKAARRGAPDVTDVPFVAGGGDRQRLDLYRPRGGAAAGGQAGMPVLAVLHGGAFRFGSRKDAHVSEFCRACAEAGVLVASVGYRLNTPWPGQLDDALAALRWLRESAAVFGGDPGNMHVCGHSAGAFLACHAGMHDEVSTNVRGVIGVSGVYDLAGLHAQIPGSQLLLGPLLGPSRELPHGLSLINSRKLFRFRGRTTLLVADSELPALRGDAVALWKSPRGAPCVLREVPATTHFTIMRAPETLAHVVASIRSTPAPALTGKR